MAKLSAKEVTVGMVFEVVSQDPELEFGMDYGGGSSFTAWVSIPTGTLLEITRVPHSKNGGGKVVEYRKLGDTKEYVTFWNIFRSHTMLTSGTAAIVAPVVVSSTGSFAGFNIVPKKVEMEDYTKEMGFSEFKLFFEFQGSFTGVSKVNTKLINQIKTSPGFKDEIMKLIDAELVTYRPQIDVFIAGIDRSKSYFSLEYSRRRMSTWYSGGKLCVETFVMDDFATYRRDLERLIDQFIASKATHTVL